MIHPGPAADSFVRWLDAQASRVDDALERISDQLDAGTPNGAGLAARYAIQGEGKRLRPALCVAAYHATNGSADDAPVFELASAIELIHTYSLVHDDLPCMDNDALRRGRPTTHVVYGNNAALYAGAALIPLAFQTLLRASHRLGLSAPVTQASALELARAAGAAGMVGGQVMDLQAEGRATSLADLESLHLAKTGALIAAAARIGGRAGGAGPDALQAFRVFGRCVGLAFQITDDILDVTASSGRLGKTSGKDRAVAKATFPAFMGIDGALRRARQEVDRALATLDAAGIRTWELEGIARFAIERER
jgi:geranylgeranyl pyrophosphate synthase